MIQKKRLRQYLDKFPVYTRDTTIDSQYFGVSGLPDEFKAGKNSFKILGSDYLKPKSEVQIEILDSNGNTIYHEVNDYIDRLKKRIVTVYVYPSTPIGKVTINLLGVLQDNLVPQEWRNAPNVVWSKELLVDSLKRNDSEIIFNTFPTIEIKEQFKPAVDLIYASGSFRTLTSSFFDGASVSYNNSVTGRAWAQNYETYTDLYSDGGFSNLRITGSAQLNFNSNLLKNTELNSVKLSQIESEYDYSLINKDGPTIKLNITGSDLGFTKKMIGGEFSVTSPITLANDGSMDLVGNDPYTGKIVDVLNSTTLRLASAYYATSSGDISFISRFGPNFDYSIKYTEVPEYTGSQAYKTFATINLANFNPISGDVYRIKTYVKSKSTLSEFELVGNSLVNSTNLLIDEDSITTDLPIGFFTSQSIIDNYWFLSNIANTVGYTLPEVSSSILTEGTTLSGSFFNAPIKFYPFKSSSYYEDNEYQLKFNCIATNVTGSQKLKVFMSGSSFADSDDYNTGYEIGSITVTPQTSKVFQDLSFSFLPSSTNLARPVFLAESGDWTISNIEILSQTFPGFTPNFVKLNVPINSIWDNNTLDFKFEFFDYTEKMANQLIYLENTPFTKGSPFYIQGNYNLLTGSQYVGNQLNSGLVLSGTEGSSFYSIGYQGFTSASYGFAPSGFAIWSGSFQSGSVDNYTGIGAEFVASSESYFRYRTEPSELDIRTDKFFLGGPNMYISGSNGQLEISSSNFYVSNTGYLTATGATLRQYIFADYIAARVLVIDSSNVDTYLIRYTHPTISKTFTYLDLSAVNKDSAMFIQFNVTGSHPISHIVAPTIDGFIDNEVGGNIVIEFGNATAGDGVYFYDLRKDVTDEHIEFTNAYNLSGSNSIHNLSGSFSYLGYSAEHLGAGGTEYTGSLAGRESARYTFSKGYNGWSLSSTSNFDRNSFSLLDANIAFLKGTRRNDFMRPNQLLYTNTIVGSSYRTSFDTNFMMPCIELNPAGYAYQYIYGSYLLPDYIRSNKIRAIVYYSFIPTAFVAGTYTVTWAADISCTNSPVDDDFVNGSAPALTSFALLVGSGTNADFAMTSGAEMTAVAFESSLNATYMKSGQLIGFRLGISNIRRGVTNVAGKIRIFGVRLISDLDTNVGGFIGLDFQSKQTQLR